MAEGESSLSWTCLETSAGQSRVDDGADSDSNDSLFITQKPVARPVRSRRWRHSSLRSNTTYDEETGSDSSSSSSNGESQTHNKQAKKTQKLPKYSFPFVSERKWMPKSCLLPVPQNKRLHYCAMAGFFDCVTKVYPGAQESLPTVDTEEESISPLSEEEEQGPDDEDIKVVERKCFLASSKPKGPQRLRRKAGKAREETTRGKGCKTIHKASDKAATSVVDTERSEDVESSVSVSGQRQGKDEGDQTVLIPKETPTTRSLLQQTQEMLHQKTASEEELSDDSDATVCELPQVQESPKVDSQRERETSTTMPETQTDNLHMDDLSQTEDEPQSQSLLPSVSEVMSGTPSNTVFHGIRTKNKHKDNEGACKELSVSHGEPEAVHAAQSVNIISSQHEDNMEEPSAPQLNDELEFNERNCIESPSYDVSVMTQEERCVSDSTPKKKKKRKKDKSFKENVSEEVGGNLVPDLGIEDSVLTVSCKLDKEKRKRSHEDVEHLELDPAADIKKKKKKGKREKTILDAGEQEEEDTSSKILDLVLESNGHSQVSGNGSENGIASGETAEPSHAKRKKRKKKHQFSPNDAVEVGNNGADVSFSHVSVTLEESIEVPQKRNKKKTKSNELDMSYTNEENEKVEDVDGTQKAEEDLKDQNTELVTKKKKKKKKKIMHEHNMTEDDAAQNTDSVSAWKKEKKRASSFLVADTEETDVNKELDFPAPSERAKKPSVIIGDFNTESGEITGCLLESCNGVKKKKRKKSVKQDSMEKDNNGDFEQHNRNLESPLLETTEARVKEKKETELMSATSIRLESETEFKHSSTYGDSVLKKKKKKCKDLEGESLSAPVEEPRDSTRKKKKKGSEASAVCSILPISPLLSEKSESAASPSNNVIKNKKMKVKRRLHNPNEAFLTDSCV